jgi:hypothetical protein
VKWPPTWELVQLSSAMETEKRWRLTSVVSSQLIVLYGMLEEWT